MGIALLALSDLFTPFQALAHRWMPAAGKHRRRAAPVALDADLRYVQVRPSQPGTPLSPTERTCQSAVLPSRPLRVVRVAESGMARTSGRVLLSGRLEDVCAELDRLAALEAAQTPQARARHLH